MEVVGLEAVNADEWGCREEMSQRFNSALVAGLGKTEQQRDQLLSFCLRASQLTRQTHELTDMT
jgi:hypothetical protein